MADVSRRLSVWLGGLLLSCAPVQLLADEPLSSVADLRYGVTLYHYYQQDHLNALSELLVARERDGIRGHGDNPELIEAGISLSFGLQRHAEALYEQLLHPRRPPEVRDAAWFYLGKLHYMRGNLDRAEDYLARTSDALEQPFAAERVALGMSLRIRRGQLPAAPPTRREREAWGEWQPFVLYNLGAVHARAGDYAGALHYYQLLAGLPAGDAEQLALRDKGYTGAGYAYLLQKDYPQAITRFSHVRRDGPLAYQALLGYGWAALEQGDPAGALKPWQQLRTGSLIHPPVQESLLALPHAYERLGAEVEALTAYETAESLLEQELVLIDDLRARLTYRELLAAIDDPAADREVARAARLLAVEEPFSDNWLLIDRTSAIRTRSAYLAELFSDSQFQTQVQELRDLVRLQRLLRAWQPKLLHYAELLRNKQALRARRAAQLREQRVFEQYAGLADERDALRARLERIAGNADYLALADEDSLDLYLRVSLAQRNIDRLYAAGRDTAEQQASVDLYRGILLWQAAQAYPDRLWQGQRLVRDLDAQLEALADSDNRVQRILATDFDIEPRLQQLADAGQRVEAQLAQADRALVARAQALQVQIDSELASHQRRLNQYLAQTRLAAARLYDSALQRQQP
jgi:hypothetical protein